MTITSNQAAPSVEELDVDERPGSSDITWAERAYHHQRREQANERRQVPLARRRRWRIFLSALAIAFLLAGMVVAMRYEGSSPSPVVHQPTSSQTATTTQPVTGQQHFTLTPPLLPRFPSLLPTIDTPKR